MSRLAELIRKSSRVETARMGFGSGAAGPPSPTVLCLVRLGAGESNKAGEAAEKGADAVILEGADLSKSKQLPEGLSVGVRLSKPERAAIAAQREVGADFVVLEGQSAPGEALLESGIGLVLTLGRDVSDTTLRLLGDLPLDALLVPPPEEPLTVARLLELRRLAALSRTPLLMEVSAEVDAWRLQALRDAGVAGVIIEGRAIGRLGRLREAVMSMPARGRRREERAEAILPVRAAVAADEDEYEDEE